MAKTKETEMDKEVDWQSFRREAALKMLTLIADRIEMPEIKTDIDGNPIISITKVKRDAATFVAVQYADSLIRRLKEKEEWT